MTAVVDGSLMSILLVDDDPTFVRQVSRYLEGAPGARVIGKAYDGMQATEQSGRLHPDLVLLDWRLGSELGRDVIPAIKLRVPGVRVIVLTTMEPSYREVAMASGADGFVHKFHLVDDLLPEIERVMLAAGR